MVINCFGGKRHKLHRPRTEEQCKKWASFPNIKWTGKKRSSLNICEMHFSEVQYERDLMHELIGSKKKKKLKQDAVPDLLLTTASESLSPSPSPPCTISSVSLQKVCMDIRHI